MGIRTHRFLLPAALLMVMGSLSLGGAEKVGAEGIFDDVEAGFFSIGGRGTYFDPRMVTANGSEERRSVFINPIPGH